ncbi:MAG: hypothetical protein HYY01_08240 [Chloroflexi bacterium]|nr:hypothetical protein [Chloroflexota bacterium]
MMNIVTIELKTATPDQLMVDIVVNLPSGRYHIGQLAYTKKGLYLVPLTYKATASPIDVHDSYHPGGEMHGKLTKGELLVYPGKQVLGKAKPHTQDKEALLWQRKGQPWDSLKGVERLSPHQKGAQGFASIEATAAGYPIISLSSADHVFEIEGHSLQSKMIDLAVYLVAEGNSKALEDELCKNMALRPVSTGCVTVEKAELFTNLNPWLAIVLFCK